MYQFTGSVKSKTDTQKVSEKFSKRDFVVVDNRQQYPQPIQFQVNQDKCGLLDSVKVGDEVTVHFNLQGREWKDPAKPAAEPKHFNTLTAYKIEIISKTSAANAPVAAAPPF